MTDAARSQTMRAVKSHDTAPELAVRRLLHGMGFRYRLHRTDLPGKPDLAFGSLKAAVFVHGCFWHGHDCKRGARVPKTNRDYWVAKVARNRARDTKVLTELRAADWRTAVVWECELRDPARVARKLSRFLKRKAR